MPNIKIYIDQSLPEQAHSAVRDALVPIRRMLCDALGVEKQACQVAILSVYAMDDLPRVNVEVSMLPKPDRTREKITRICTDLQEQVAAAAGSHTAVRALFLDADTYVALK